MQVKDLPAHQMDHMRTDSLDLSAVPFLCGVFSQQVEVFMVAADEQRGKGQILQPVQIPLLLLAPIPYAAKISADDHVVFLGHSGLLGEVFGCEALEVAMGIAGCIDHFSSPSFAYYIIPCSTWMPPRRNTVIFSAELTLTVSTSCRMRASSHSLMWVDA